MTVAPLTVSAATKPQLITTCSNYVGQNQPPYTEAIWQIFYNGDPLTAYAYLDWSTGPVSFSYSWQNPYLYVYVTNNNNYAVSYEFTACAKYN
jgi:hypothetical protein